MFAVPTICFRFSTEHFSTEYWGKVLIKIYSISKHRYYLVPSAKNFLLRFFAIYRCNNFHNLPLISASRMSVCLFFQYTFHPGFASCSWSVPCTLYLPAKKRGTKLLLYYYWRTLYNILALSNFLGISLEMQKVFLLTVSPSAFFLSKIVHI